MWNIQKLSDEICFINSKCNYVMKMSIFEMEDKPVNFNETLQKSNWFVFRLCKKLSFKKLLLNGIGGVASENIYNYLKTYSSNLSFLHVYLS